MTDREDCSCNEEPNAASAQACKGEAPPKPSPGEGQEPSTAASADKPGPTSEGSNDPAASGPDELDVEFAPAVDEKAALLGQLEDSRKATERAREQMLRVAADFDNYRKRTSREIEDARRRSKQAQVRDLLPVFDNLERAMTVGESTDAAAIRDGLKLVLKQFVDTLKKQGIDRLEPVGDSFDPMLHESIQLVESAEHRAGCVVAVVQPGYRMGAELLRPAMVVVSKGPAAVAAAPNASGADAASATSTEPSSPEAAAEPSDAPKGDPSADPTQN